MNGAAFPLDTALFRTALQATPWSWVAGLGGAVALLALWHRGQRP